MGRANGRAALKEGGRGSFLGKQPSIVDGIGRTSRQWAIAHFYPLEIYSYVGLCRKMTTRTSNLLGEVFFGGGGLFVPSLSNGMKGRLPPTCGGGWDHFLFQTQSVFGALTSQHPIDPTATTMRR
jgi:hypothetical protein